MSGRAVVVLCLLAWPAAARAQRDPCAGVDCSGAGACFVEHRAAHCLCDAGYAALGHACVEVEEPDVLRARRDPSAGQRVADLALSQVERDRREVGRGVDGLAIEPLGAYLEAEEWWCTDFVAWVCAAAGVPFSQGAAGGWLVTNNIAMRAWFVQKGLWRARRELGGDDPRPGDYMRVHTDGGGHSAIVHHVEGTTLYAVEGNVSGRVELARYYRYRDHRHIDGFGRLTPPNAPPEVRAGDDARVVLPSPAELRGEVSDDGPEERLRIDWELVSGPGRVTFEPPSASQTEARFERAGRYRLRLRARDGEHDVEDALDVEVVTNAPPVVRARLIELSAFERRATLGGEASDDGELRPMTFDWRQREGPGPATFDRPSEACTDVRFPSPGTYRLRLVADDGAAESHADVEVVMPSWRGGCAVWGAAPTPSAVPPLAGALLAGALLWRRGRAPRAG